MKKWLIFILPLQLLFLLWGMPNKCMAANQTPLPADKAFIVSAKMVDADTLLLEWKIAPHHYLYQDRLHFTVLKPSQTHIGHILFPPAIPKQDEILGHYAIYKTQVTIPIPLLHPDLSDTQLQIHYQGCSEDGYCYPPITRILTIKNGLDIEIQPDINPQLASPTVNNSQEKPFLTALSSGHVIRLVLTFFCFGVLLSLTPCVLPMIPILSGIIVGHQKTALKHKTFRLSLVYVLSMSFTYAIGGILAGWIGSSIQVLFQKPLVILLFALLFVGLAFSFFGFYTLKLPDSITARFTHWSNHQKTGHYIGVAVMGCLATLVISPCVTPALVGVLGYISQTGNAALGGIALFSLSLGMGLPLLILGAAGGKLLPKSGPWMKTVEHIFGVFFIAFAIWMISRIVSPPLILLLWGALCVICAVYLGAFLATPLSNQGKLIKGLGILVFLYGILLIIGATQGNLNPLKPLVLTTPLIANATDQQSLVFISVKSIAELDTALAKAKAQQQPVLIDFYADWCISCQEMANTTFKDPKVKQYLQHFMLIKADVTTNDHQIKMLMQQFKVIAPPTFFLINKQGQLLTDSMRVGKLDPATFLHYLITLVPA